MIHNPVLPGFNPDPCICRRGDDYYLMVSSFEWMPCLPVYHSKDLENWELLCNVLGDDKVDLKKLPSSKGIWAPCLTWCESEGLFYVVYGVMNSMNARYFDVDNFVITSPNITGPWSESVYLHSAGFDASILHDDDGKKYIVSLEWETRDSYEKPGVICLAEYDSGSKKIKGYPKRIWRGGTDRGCIEAPHLYKKNGWYYLMCAEGGTGYNHCVTVARAKNVWGPYESDPENPIITSQPSPSNERADSDHLKPIYYNPDSVLQKSGHGSLVETPSGEPYVAHLCSRPFVPELCCTLGRETAIQKMRWTADGWLRMADGGNIAKEEVPSLLDSKSSEEPKPLSIRDDFDGEKIAPFYYAPRQNPERFASVSERKGWLRLTGGESLCSLNRVSLLCRKLTSLNAEITVKMDFSPEIYQHSAGLVFFYDNMDYIFLRKYWSDTLKSEALGIIELNNGVKTEYKNSRIAAPNAPILLKLKIDGRQTRFFWSDKTDENASFTPIGKPFATSHLSDEYCSFGEFTGAMVGIACVDQMFHRKNADFDFFEYKEL